jgi:methyl-accepting chemotaxis protein
MKWFYDLKLAKKLIISFVMVAIIAGIVGTVGIVNLSKLEQKDTELYDYMTVPISEAGQMLNLMQRIRVNTRELILQDNAENKKQINNTLQTLRDQLDETSLSFEKTIQSEEVRTYFNKFQTAKLEYRSFMDELMVFINSEEDDKAYEFLNNTMREPAKNQEEALNQIVALKITDAKKTSDDNTAQARQAMVIMIVLVLLAMSVAIILGIWIARLISKPINQIVEMAGKAAEGDLDVELTVSSKDEIGKLAAAFNHMTYNINEVLENISASADQVTSGSTQVAETGMVLSQGATEQASTIEELTASLEEISSQTNQNAENAESANKLATDARKDAVIGNDQMKEMLNAMHEINESSNNISKIIKVIDEIAFQTNILALNAAVEAARAGQHGKGFAVVAEEVRNLAARSANAAKETTDMIEGSIRKVEDGTRIANETAGALNQIVDVVTEVTEIVSQIARASHEQAIGISQITEGVTQVSQVTQTNSATSEESAAASEELSSQAELLKEQVSRFNLKRTRTYRNSSDSQLEEYSPEVMRMLEQMSNHSQSSKSNSRGKKSNSNMKIELSDQEFGKY